MNGYSILRDEKLRRTSIRGHYRKTSPVAWDNSAVAFFTLKLRAVLPHSAIASSIGFMVWPNSVISYSTLGGTSAYTSRGKYHPIQAHAIVQPASAPKYLQWIFLIHYKAWSRSPAGTIWQASIYHQLPLRPSAMPHVSMMCFSFKGLVEVFFLIAYFLLVHYTISTGFSRKITCHLGRTRRQNLELLKLKVRRFQTPR
jgi:hypothetical protein